MQAAFAVALSAVATVELPVQRHVGQWSAPPHRVPTSMMFDSPIAGNGDAGLTFAGPPEHTTFYLGSNSFWSANQQVDARPSFNQKPGGAESYTQVRVGDVQVMVPSLKGASYAAAQDLHRATVNATHAAPGCTLSHESFVTNPDNLVVTRFTVSGGACGNATVQLLSGSSPGRYGPTRAGVGTDGTPWVARASVSATANTITAGLCFIGGQHAGSQLWTLAGPNRSVTTADGRCVTAVPAGGNATKLTVGDCSSSPETRAWHAVPMGPAEPALPQIPGYVTMPGYVGGQPPLVFKCTEPGNTTRCAWEAAGACNASATCTSFGVYVHDFSAAVQLYGANKTRGSYPDAGWNSWRKTAAVGPPMPPGPPPTSGLVLRNSVTGACAGLDVNGEFLVAAPCVSASRWGHDAASQHLWAVTGNHSWGRGRCLTAVEPNPMVVAAVALRLVDGSGRAKAVGATTDGVKTSTFELDLDAQGGSFTLVAGVVTAGDCTGCDPNTTAPEATAAALVARPQSAPAALASAHAAWWQSYWASGASVDLGPSWQRLEGFYYGMQYQIGSASRPNRFAPGLWGPWLTSDTCGWSGDYTLNYNFEANFYGVFSDGRPQLAEPYFRTILNAVDLGKWRASMAYWGTGTSSATPGFWAQDFNHMDQLSDDGSGFVKAGYKGLQMPTHLSPWKHFYFVSDWGQKNVGAFTSKAFMDYVDFTGNQTFLRDVAYPFVRLNGEFYASYMTKINGRYNVMHSCAMEGCGAQGGPTSSNITVSNNPPFDLGFVRRTFRALLKYSAALGVDAEQRPAWQDILDNVADYPLTKTEAGETVFAQATLNPGATSSATDGFPNASKCVWATGAQNGAGAGVGAGGAASAHDTSQCGNARYPITFFNAMHPGEDVDLASDRGLLAIARRTVATVNAMNDYSPTNGLCMAWPPAARVVESAGALLAAFDKALNDTMMPNFIPFILNRPTGGSGCNVENSGATVAVNDLMASVHGHGDNARLVLFPGGWPGGAPVSFDKVRVRGAFDVSASATGSATGGVTLSGPVRVTSLAGNNLTIAWSGDSRPTVTLAGGGSPVAVTAGSAAGTWRFATETGVAYDIK